MNKIFKYSKLKISVWIFILITITFYNCGSDELTVKYDPVPYVIEYPDNFDAPVLPGDNALTIEGVKLGKMLFMINYYQKMAASLVLVAMFNQTDFQMKINSPKV